MEKKNIDWSSLGFGYVQTDYRYVSKFKDGAWDAGELTTDPNVTLNECAGVFQYAQTAFEGMKAQSVWQTQQRDLRCLYSLKTVSLMRSYRQ